MTRKWPVVGLLLAVLWLFVRGVDLAPMAVLGEFLIGLAVGLPIAYWTRRFYLAELDLARSVRAAPYAGVYVAAFLTELLTANVDVAYRVLHPSMPIDPDVLELPLRIETDAAVTTLANSITLTPGTLTMDHDADSNTLYVHAMTATDPAAVEAPIRSWEDYLLVIFDEERKPGDPVPESGTAAETDAESATAAATDAEETEDGTSAGVGDLTDSADDFANDSTDDPADSADDPAGTGGDADGR